MKLSPEKMPHIENENTVFPEIYRSEGIPEQHFSHEPDVPLKKSLKSSTVTHPLHTARKPRQLSGRHQ